MHSEHYRKLENMYLSANFNQQIYDTTTAKISAGAAEIGLEVTPKYFHALGAMHGSVYFKLLDDAAFFAVNSLVTDVFVLTQSFNIHFVRPCNSGIIMATGTVKFASPNLYVAESTLVNAQGKEIGFGTGNFVKSKIALDVIKF